MSSLNTVEIMDRGLDCLIKNLGVIETERFISTIMRERFDYTEWRKELFGDMSLEELAKAAVEYEGAHPFVPKKQLLSID